MSTLTDQLKALLMVPSPQRAARAARMTSAWASPASKPVRAQPALLDPNATAEVRLDPRDLQVLPFRAGNIEEALARSVRRPAPAHTREGVGFATEEYIAPAGCARATPWDPV